MLSILIPIYNFDCNDFVEGLSQQAEKAKIDFEILLIDDASDKEFDALNSRLGALNKVSYMRLDENIGRSKIRNLLVSKSKFDYLLIFDCDSEINNSDFIQNYLDQKDLAAVVYGGRNYNTQMPENKAFRLRWLYGRKREEVLAKKRKKNPYLSFMTNNFLVHKSVFDKVLFDEEIDGYGYEDSAFSHQLYLNGISIDHIDNPLKHIGLETADEFIFKSLNAIRNLVKLVHEGKLPIDIKLYRAYTGLKKTRTEHIFFKGYKKVKPKLLENLTSAKPSLKYFDFFRLGELLAIKD